MTVRLADGGTLTVLPSGQVEFRKNGQTFRTDGRGTYALSAAWVGSLAYGPDVRYVTHNR